MTGPMGNRVGIGRDTGANRKEEACHSLARRESQILHDLLLSLSSRLKMEAVCFSETLTSTDESTRRQNQDEDHHPHRRENLTSHTWMLH
jgi:hypothetical protein